MSVVISLACDGLEPHPAPPLESTVRRTSGTITMRWILAVFLMLTSATLSAQIAAVNMSNVYQPIDGFGAASVYERAIPSSVIDEEFSSTGIGLKFIRLQIVPDYADCLASTFNRGCVQVASGATLTTYDLQNVQAAVAQGAVVWATLWSPPGYMKSNGSYATGGEMIGNPSNYTDLAAIEVSFVTLMTGTYGIPIYAISIQNEPEVSTSYPSCVWGEASASTGAGGAASGAAMFAAFVPYLSSALAAAGYSNTKIMMAEPGHWNYDYMGYTMQQPEIAPLVGIIASHAYGGTPTAYSPTAFNYSQFTTHHIWETEVGDENAYDGSMVSGLTYALMIHNWLTIAKVNAWNYWELTGELFYDNEGLTDRSNVFAKRAYVMGNWARFVTGMSEVAATANPQSGVYVTAFLNLTTGASAIVAINMNSTAVSEAFAIAGRPGPGSYTVVPYVTDPDNSLVPQSALNVSGNSFTATLTGSSVTSFVIPVPITLVGVVLRPAYGGATMTVGDTMQMVAHATYSDGSSGTLPDQYGNAVTWWNTTNHRVAVISSMGHATAKAAGSIDLEGMVGALQATSWSVTVTDVAPPDSQ